MMDQMSSGNVTLIDRLIACSCLLNEVFRDRYHDDVCFSRFLALQKLFS